MSSFDKSQTRKKTKRKTKARAKKKKMTMIRKIGNPKGTCLFKIAHFS
jgi:hypothetical protein